MKKKLVVLFVVCSLLLSLAGCGTSYQEATSENNGKNFCDGYFTMITM